MSSPRLGALADPALDDRALADLYAEPSPSWLRVNFVASIDGAVTVDGYTKSLSSPDDKRVFGILRMRCDALLVGAGTLRGEGYGAIRLDERRRAWRRAQGLALYPTLVVVSDRLDLSPDQPAFAEAPIRPIVLTHLGAPADRRAALEPVADVSAHGDGAVDLTAALAALHERGLRRILCEGGPHLLGALTAADLVDEMDLTIAPLLAGPGAGRVTGGPSVDNAVRRMRLRHVLYSDDVLILRYDRSG